MTDPLTVHSRKLRPGDKVRFVSPASIPDWQLIMVREAEHSEHLGVPVLDGLPLGQGHKPLSTPPGSSATLDAEARTMTVVPVKRA